MGAPKLGAFRESLHFAIRNKKFVFGFCTTLFLLMFAIVGPYLAQHPALEYGGQLGLSPTTKDGYWFGTTLLGQDVFAQFATGLRLAFIVGAARRRDRRDHRACSSASPPATGAGSSTRC